MDPQKPAGVGTRNCKLCDRTFPLHEVRRCPVCHTHFCRDCGVISSGRRFCSRGCGLFDAYYESGQDAKPSKPSR